LQGTVVWMDGELVPWDQAKVHISSNSLHYGSAVFEGVRGYYHDGEIYVFKLREHIRRLIESAKIIMLKNPYSEKDLIEATVRTLRENRYTTNVYIRPILYGGENVMTLDPQEVPVRAAILTFPLDKFFKKFGLRVGVSTWRRVPDTSLPPRAKASANYLNSMLATRDARQAGYDEAILLDQNGYVSEGPGENIFLVKDRMISTPPASSAILEGITRGTVITLARDLGYQVVERPISRVELYTADELFFTGTAVEIQPIIEVDGRVVADGQPGAVTKQLYELYQRVVRGLEPRYRSWLTPVYNR
jgi:branched-chain amino acid aminotransferase